MNNSIVSSFAEIQELLGFKLENPFSKAFVSCDKAFSSLVLVFKRYNDIMWYKNRKSFSDDAIYFLVQRTELGFPYWLRLSQKKHENTKLRILQQNWLSTGPAGDIGGQKSISAQRIHQS